MMETKTPPPRSESAMDDALPGDSTPFGDSSLLDLDDPHITGSLFAGFADGSEPLLGHATSLIPAEASSASAPNPSTESSFAQLWARTDDQGQAHPPEPLYPTDHFASWQKAAELYQLPPAVELLPPSPLLPDKEVAASPPTGFFSPDDAPLFFVDELWSPEASLSVEHVSQNPFEESVAVLNELSFQNAFQQPTPLGSFGAPAQPLFAPLSSYGHSPEEASTTLFANSEDLFANNADFFSDNADAFHPSSLSLFAANTDTPSDSALALSSHQHSPPALQSNLWFLDSAEEDSEEIILLEDELPPDEKEEPAPSVDVYNLQAAPAKSFPPAIPPVLADSSSLLSPAIFYDAADTQWPLASADFQLPGFYEVVLYTMNGTVKRGAFQDVDLSLPSVPLHTPEETEHIAVQHIKAVYFLKPQEGEGPFFPLPATEPPCKVVFNDGRCVNGQLLNPQENAAGFFLIPTQEKSPTACLYINRLAVLEISQDVPG